MQMIEQRDKKMFTNSFVKLDHCKSERQHTRSPVSTAINHNVLQAFFLINISDWHRSQLHSSDDAGVSEPHPSRFLG